MKFQQIGDKAAIGISLLCVMHCLLTPIVMLLIPPLSAVLALNHEAFHTWLLFAVLPISTIALLLGYLHHHSRYVF